MITNIKNFLKKYWLFVVLGLIGLFVLITLFLFGKGPEKELPIITPNGTISSPIPSVNPSNVPLNEQFPIPGVDYSVSTPADEISSKQDEAVVKLINILPYKGKNIYLSYSFSNFQFTLQENELLLEESEKEFNELLAEYGIKDRSWLKNLVVQKIKGTQEETSTSPDYLFGR